MRILSKFIYHFSICIDTAVAFIALSCSTAFAQADTTVIFHKADSLINQGNALLDEENLEDAIKLFSEAANLTKEVENGINFYYATAMENIGIVYYYTNDYINALNYFLQTIGIWKEIYGEDNLDYSASLNNIGVLYSKIGDFQNALKFSLESMEIDKRLLGEEHQDYANTLSNIGNYYRQAGDYDNALKYNLKALKIKGKVLGEEHPSYALSLSNIAAVYNSIGDWQNAIKYNMQALEIRGKVLGKEHPNYAMSLSNLASVLDKAGDYSKALKYNLQALKIRKDALGEEHPSYAISLNNLASVYENIGDYRNALIYSTMAAEIQERIIGAEHPDYASTISNIGHIYLKMRDYQNALKYHLQALEIREKVLGTGHPDYTISINNLSVLYNDMGDYKNALKYGYLALKMQKENNGEEHPYYATTLNNIGHTYFEMKNYENALKYQIQAMEIRKKIYGEKNPEYAISASNIGSTYTQMGDYENAMKYGRLAVDIQKEILGENHPYYAISMNNLGMLYLKIGDYTNALKYCSRASEILKENFGNNNLEYAEFLNAKSGIFFKMGYIEEAIKTNRIAFYIQKNNLIRNFSFMTSKEREYYWNINNEYFHNNARYSSHNTNDTIASKVSYNSELVTKGLLLASEISLTNTIMESGDTALISEYETMKIMQMQLNKELERPIAERFYNCDSLENEIKKTERHIMEASKEFGDITHFIKIDWNDVQRALKTNDVAIEFANFTENDTTKYIALVLTKKMEAPACVPLFNQYEITNILRGTTTTKENVQNGQDNRGSTLLSAKRQGIYESTNLYNALWKPLEKYFTENARIYFAPSGELHQIAVEYAPVDQYMTISDKYEIYRMSSTRFLAMEYMPKPMKNSVLYGGIFYDSDTTTMKQESDRYSTRSVSISSFSDLNKEENHGSLNYLPGTKTEVENIYVKLKKKKVKTTVYEGSAANEESFKALSGKDIEMLHVATHGFFLPTDEKLTGDQSLIQSGLLFSGANYAWQNQPVPEGIEDGVLTAKEISFMDLRKTDLVVLSACQTALGEITGEGVFGLQRGFKKAGARTIIMSLWPVDDNATLLMMTEFYTNLAKGMSKREAFIAAQNKVKTSAGFENPRFWAAFIMLDGNK